ncbi:MAG: adenosylcobinamide-GDP ribazoletransferase, partial [Desulfobulbus sp.]
MQSLILMIQFMTRYPIPLTIEFTAKHFVCGMKWMPLVGLLAGLPGALAFALADTWLNREIAALFSVIMLITVTGGLHLDGIADTADGLFSYRSRERMLEIMRDSTLGANGVIALVLTILLKFTLLAHIPGKGALLAVLVTPVLGRTALTWHSACARYAREVRGIGDYVNQTGLIQALAATAVSFSIILALLALFGVHAALIPAVA